MIRLLVTLALTALACSGASAAEATVALGVARVRYDDGRWTATVSASSVRFEPQGEAMRRVDPVELHATQEPTPCAVLAARAFALGAYDERELTPMETTIGDVAGVRISGHTRCRNATPRGEVACVRVGRRAYLLQAVQPGCGGRNLFSGIDPLAEIASGITFMGR